MRAAKYTLTKRAEADLEELYRNSLEQYGSIQTNKFMNDLKKAAEFAADNIGKVPTRAHLTGESGLSLYPVNNHFIAYRPVTEKHIVVIAIFRQSRDVVAMIAAEADRFRAEFSEIEQSIKNGTIKIKSL
jgi:plasmid stabilization system protein ParE